MLGKTAVRVERLLLMVYELEHRFGRNTEAINFPGHGGAKAAVNRTLSKRWRDILHPPLSAATSPFLAICHEILGRPGPEMGCLSSARYSTTAR